MLSAIQQSRARRLAAALCLTVALGVTSATIGRDGMVLCRGANGASAVERRPEGLCAIVIGCCGEAEPAAPGQDAAAMLLDRPAGPCSDITLHQFALGLERRPGPQPTDLSAASPGGHAFSPDLGESRAGAAAARRESPPRARQASPLRI